MSIKVLNALTIDLEDWYQVSNLEKFISFNDWTRQEDRLEKSVGKLLDLFKSCRVQATFFVLGWNAERHPDLIKQIVQEGHEVGTHGYSHRLVYNQSPIEFADDLKRSIDAISDASGMRVLGHRAASFSVTAASTWAIDVLAEQGIEYDSSIFPIKHSRYGIPEAPRFPYTVQCKGRPIIEFPISTVQLLGHNIPFAGGAYFRLLPYGFVKNCIRQLNRKNTPVMFYLHPWEVDPGQPRMDMDWKLKLRCYHNIEKVEDRLAGLLSEFAFGRAADVIASISHERFAYVKAVC